MAKGGKNMSITSDLIRGHTEMIIMAQLYNGDSYGYKINKSIQEASDGQYELKEATLYGAFRRLEENGYISSYWGDETTGARRRYYKLTAQGKEFYKLCRLEWENAKSLIDKLIGGK
jgi:DNA-binding PadR family transcriptional regulator